MSTNTDECFDVVTVDPFILSIEEFLIEKNGETKKAYKIKAELIKPHGYFHCAYSNIRDARRVLEKLTEGFSYTVYRVNFNNTNPLKVRDSLDI